MKILVVFIDMVRVDHLYCFNPEVKVTNLDQRLTQMGGTLFTRCYSPGPDTPRSLACMQTGLFPYANGCNTRIRWPKFFTKKGVTTIWDTAVSKGWKVNLCCNKNECLTGFFKYNDSQNIKLFYTPVDFIQNSNFCENSISFIGIPDMHTAISDYKATEYAFRKGDEIVDLYFKKYLSSDFISQFDYTVVFSDHGFQLEEEGARMSSRLELLNDGRNQLLLFIHKQTDTSIIKDNRLASIVDLYAALIDLMGEEDFRHGFSLLREPQRSITHIEDHTDFNVYPEIMVKQWRVISDTFDIRTDVKRTLVTRGSDSDIVKMESYLKEFSPHYSEYVKQLQILDFYEKLKSEEKRSQYFVGVDRASSIKLFWIKAAVKVKRKLFSLIKK